MVETGCAMKIEDRRPRTMMQAVCSPIFTIDFVN